MSVETDNSKPGKSFQADFIACWQRLPNKGFFFLLLIVWLCLFRFMGSSTLGYIHSPSLFRWTFNVYDNKTLGTQSSDDAIGYMIPFVVIGLLWWKREQLLGVPLKIWPPALLLVIFALALHFLGYLVEEPRISIIALFVGVYGITGLAWGAGWLRRSFYPFVLFAFCVPVSEQLLPLTFPLRILVSTLTEWIAHGVFGIGVTRVGTQLFDPLGSYQYDVAAACSGIRSLMSIFLLAMIWAFIMFRSPWKRLLIISLAFPMAILGNLLRMLCIIVAAEAGGQSTGNYVHEGGPFGIISLIPYVPAIWGLLWAGNWLNKKTGPD